MTQHRSQLHAQQNPCSALKSRAEPVIMPMVRYNRCAEWCVTRTGPQGVGRALRPAASMFPSAILTDSGRNCKGYLENFIAINRPARVCHRKGRLLFPDAWDVSKNLLLSGEAVSRCSSQNNRTRAAEYSSDTGAAGRYTPPARGGPSGGRSRWTPPGAGPFEAAVPP